MRPKDTIWSYSLPLFSQIRSLKPWSIDTEFHNLKRGKYEHDFEFNELSWDQMSERHNKLLHYPIYGLYVANFAAPTGLNSWSKDYKFHDLEGFMNITCTNIHLVY